MSSTEVSTTNQKGYLSSTFERFTTLMANIFQREKVQQLQLLQLQQEEAQRKKKEHEEMESRKRYERSMLENELEENFSKAIRSHDETRVVLTLKKGFRPNLRHHLSMIYHEDAFSSQEVRQQIQQFLADDISGEIFKHLATSFRLFKDDDSYSSRFLYEGQQQELKYYSVVLSKIHQHIGLDKLLGDDAHIFKTWDTCKRLINLSKQHGYSNREKFEALLGEIVAKIEQEKKHFVEMGVSQELEKYNAVFHSFQSVKKNIIDDIVKNVSQFNESQLPTDCQELLQKIKTVYEEVPVNQLSPQQQHDFENLYKKSLPKVLEEYITISPRYREKLKSLPDNPEVLLHESLQEIYHKVQQMADIHQENNLHQLKVTHRYLNNM